MTFEINVSDNDFSSVGDSVDATLVLNGSDAGTTTLSSPGTASVTVSNVSGGQHSYYWRVTDDYGYEVTSATFEFKAPLIVYVHDGNDQSSLVTSTTITAEIIETNGDFRETRTVSDGKIAAGDVPESQLIVQLTAEGYANRRILIDHPYARFDRRTILLDESEQGTFQQCFGIDSQGAGFEPADTWLVVERYIAGEWRDAAGSYFGSTNSACVAVTDTEEYRLNVRQGTRSKDLGGYTADIGFENQVLTLTVRSVDVGISAGEPHTMIAKGQVNETTGEGRVNITFAAHDQSVSDLHLRLYERGNESNTVFEKTVYGDVETYAGSVPIEPNATESTYVLEWSATEGEDGTISGQQFVNVYRGGVETGLSPTWKKIGFGTLILFVGGLFGPVSAPIGSVVTAGLSGALWFTGVLDLQVGVIIYAGSVSLAFYASSQLGGR